MRGRQTNQLGFTLVEVIIASGIMSIGVAMMVALTFQVHQFTIEEQMQNEVEAEMTTFLDYFCRDTMASSGILLTYPGTSKKSQKVILKVPEFDSKGLRVAKAYDYVIYEHFHGRKIITRSVYDDEEGKILVSEMDLPFSTEVWSSFADGTSLEELVEVGSVSTLQASVKRADSAAGFDYNRRFIAASTLRNAE